MSCGRALRLTLYLHFLNGIHYLFSNLKCTSCVEKLQNSNISECRVLSVQSTVLSTLGSFSCYMMPAKSKCTDSENFAFLLYMCMVLYFAEN